LRAHNAVQDNLESTLVVVGGHSDPLKNRYKAIIDEIGIRNVNFTGFVSRAELNALYSSACGLAFPSKCEGFGFPALEAMAHGCPVIAGNVTALPEVVGDAGILIDPENPSELAQAMHLLISRPDVRELLAKKGLDRAKIFTWEKTAQRTIEVWEQICQKKKLTAKSLETCL
ncbi:MAG: glycosyltransferase family 4 protein, partial [Bdellovibrionales bacterium]|nr:glycosyltransferase family 4 protein [Bdellovibrionales bacterium]